MSTGFGTVGQPTWSPFLVLRKLVGRMRCSLPVIAAWVGLTGMVSAQPPLAGERLRDCTICPEIVVIPGGTFEMGSPPGEMERSSDEGPQQRITVGAFAAGRVEVTFAEWDACVAAGGCGGYSPSDESWGRGDRPVINVSWDDAQSYVVWLSAQTGHSYRLLTEAEWEYAARAGSVTPFSTGEQIRPDQAQYDWKSSYAGSPTRASSAATTAPVGSFSANAFGLYDMHGNVLEWVQDCYRITLSGQSPHGSPPSRARRPGSVPSPTDGPKPPRRTGA